MTGSADAAAREASRPAMPVRPSKLQAIYRELYRSRVSYLFLAPFLILFFLFIITPVLASIGLSFTYYNVLEPPKWSGLTNYESLFVEDELFLKGLANTFYFSVVSGPVGYIAAFFLAWLIHRTSQRVRPVFTAIFYSPSLTSGVAMSVVWLVVFANDSYGYFNQFLIRIGFIVEPIQWLQDVDLIMPVIIIISLWMSLGVGFLAFLAGLETINKELYEAGKIDGIRSGMQELWYITLPGMKPQLLFGAVLAIVGAFKVGDISMAVAGFPSPLDAGLTVALHLKDYAVMRYEMGYASAISVILFIVIYSLGKLCFRVLSSRGD